MEKILVLTDFSENSVNAYRYAVELACKFKAQILLVYSTNGESISLTSQTRYSQILYSFAKRYACGSRLKASPEHTECLISAEPWFKAIPLLIESHRPDMVMAGSDLLQKLEKGQTHNSLQIFDLCPVIWVPEKASFQEVKNLVFVTDFTDQDPGVLEQVKQLAEQFRAQVTLVHFYSRNDFSRFAGIKKAGSSLQQNLGASATEFYLIEEEDLIEGMQDFAESHPADLFVLATRDTHLAEHYFQPVFRKTNACQTFIPVLNLYQEKQNPCAGSCEFCQPEKEEAIKEKLNPAEAS